MGGVASQASEGAVEVAGGTAPTRELLYHVKVVLFHLSFHVLAIVLNVR